MHLLLIFLLIHSLHCISINQNDPDENIHSAMSEANQNARYKLDTVLHFIRDSYLDDTTLERNQVDTLLQPIKDKFMHLYTPSIYKVLKDPSLWIDYRNKLFKRSRSDSNVPLVKQVLEKMASILSKIWNATFKKVFGFIKRTVHLIKLRFSKKREEKKEDTSNGIENDDNQIAVANSQTASLEKPEMLDDRVDQVDLNHLDLLDNDQEPMPDAKNKVVNEREKATNDHDILDNMTDNEIELLTLGENLFARGRWDRLYHVGRIKETKKEFIKDLNLKASEYKPKPRQSRVQINEEMNTILGDSSTEHQAYVKLLHKLEDRLKNLGFSNDFTQILSSQGDNTESVKRAIESWNHFNALLDYEFWVKYFLYFDKLMIKSMKWSKIPFNSEFNMERIEEMVNLLKAMNDIHPMASMYLFYDTFKRQYGILLKTFALQAYRESKRLKVDLDSLEIDAQSTAQKLLSHLEYFIGIADQKRYDDRAINTIKLSWKNLKLALDNHKISKIL